MGETTKQGRMEPIFDKLVIDQLEEIRKEAIPLFEKTMEDGDGDGDTYQTDYYHDLNEFVQVVTSANDIGQQIVVTTGKGVIPDDNLRELGTTVQVRYV